MLTPTLHSIFALLENYNERFLTGFAVGRFAFMPINVISAHLKSCCGLLAVFERETCANDVALPGWPLTFDERDGLDYLFELDPHSLFMDLAMGVIVEVLYG